MLVMIVYVPDAERRAPDTARMGKVEDLPDDLAQRMIGSGEAREPTDDELAAYHATQQVDEPAAASKATKARDKQPSEPQPAINE